jgi:hypothetical protein
MTENSRILTMTPALDGWRVVRLGYVKGRADLDGPVADFTTIEPVVGAAVNPRDRLEAFTVRAAKHRIRKDDSIRAAVLTSDETPMVKSPTCRVRLFDKVGEAEAFFRYMRQALLDQGFEQSWGTVGRGLLGFKKGDDERWLSLDKRRK